MAHIAVALIVLLFAAAAGAQTPDKIYGTAGGAITLFTPAQVVTAGGGGGGAASLSSATPLVESGSGSAGAGTSASRGDHVHPARALPAVPQPSSATPIVEGTGAAGSATAYSRGDHVHPAGGGGPGAPLSDKTPKVESAGGAPGSGTSASRDDHVHPAAGGGGGAGAGGPVTFTSFTAFSINASSQSVSGWGGNISGARSSQTISNKSFADGVLYYITSSAFGSCLFTFQESDNDHAGCVFQDAFFSVQKLEVSNSSSNIVVTWIEWPRSGARTVSGTIYEVGLPSGVALSDAKPLVDAAAVAGVGTKASREDHVHPARTVALSSFGTVGTSGQCAKANSTRNGLRYGDCGSPRVLSNANPKTEGTVAPGTSSQVSRSDHVHPAAGGGSATPLSDKAPLDLGIKSAGAGTAASREDHRHSATSFLATGIPKANAATGSAGVTTLVSRGDHVHPGAGATPQTDYGPQLADLQAVTSDLYAFPVSDNPTWAVNTSATDAQIAIITGTDNTPDISGVTFQTGKVDRPGAQWVTGYILVRLKSGEARGEYRIDLEDKTATTTVADYRIAGNSWQQITPSAGGADGSTYWRATPANQARVGDRVTNVNLEVSSNAGHLGKTEFHGDPTQVERWAIVGDATPVPSPLPAPSNANKTDIARVNAAGDAYEVVDPHAAVLSGLPALTGHGGNFLAVNSAATGLEFKAAGGEGGGGGITWTLLGSFTPSGSASPAVGTFSGKGNECRAAHLLAYETFATVILPGFGQASSSKTTVEWNLAAGVSRSTKENSMVLKCVQDGDATVNLNGKSGNTGNWFGARSVYAGIISGGGGGSSGPSIPSPTAGGAGKYLKVNSAGAAYELSDTRVTEIEDTLTNIDAPSNTNGTPDAREGDEWRVTDCQGSGNSYACEADWVTPAARNAEIASNGNLTTSTLTNSAIEGGWKVATGNGTWNRQKGNSPYRRFVFTAGWLDATSHRLTSCTLPGQRVAVPGNAANIVYIGIGRDDPSGGNWYTCELKVTANGAWFTTSGFAAHNSSHVAVQLEGYTQ